MKYRQVVQGRFLERPNRFIAIVEINGRAEMCHVKNTGRCGELLLPGAEVWLEKSANSNRKTAYDLITVRKGRELINIDSQAPNKVVLECLQKGNFLSGQGQCGFLQAKEGLLSGIACIKPEGKYEPGIACIKPEGKYEPGIACIKPEGKYEPGIAWIKPECRYGNSRIDFYVEVEQGGICKKVFIEVKGVTLEENGVARFPDAPTERGIKHLLELERAVREGYEGIALFVIQMEGIRYLEPNDRTHPKFGETLRQVQKSGVKVLAYGCKVTAGEILLDQPVEVKL